MHQEHLSGTKLYEVTWERGGECVCRFYVRAGSEADAIAEADGFLIQNPNLDRRADASVHVRILRET